MSRFAKGNRPGADTIASALPDDKPEPDSAAVRNTGRTGALFENSMGRTSAKTKFNGDKPGTKI